MCESTLTINDVVKHLRTRPVWVRKVFDNPVCVGLFYNSDFSDTPEELYVKPGAPVIFPIEEIITSGRGPDRVAQVYYREVAEYRGAKYASIPEGDLLDETNSFEITNKQLDGDLIEIVSNDTLLIHKRKGRGRVLQAMLYPPTPEQDETWSFSKTSSRTYRQCDLYCL